MLEAYRQGADRVQYDRVSHAQPHGRAVDLHKASRVAKQLPLERPMHIEDFEKRGLVGVDCRQQTRAEDHHCMAATEVDFHVYTQHVSDGIHIDPRVVLDYCIPVFFVSVFRIHSCHVRLECILDTVRDFGLFQQHSLIATHPTDRAAHMLVCEVLGNGSWMEDVLAG